MGESGSMRRVAGFGAAVLLAGAAACSGRPGSSDPNGAAGGGDATGCEVLEPGVSLCGEHGAELPIVDSELGPVVSLMLDGKPLRALIDTGSDSTIVSSSWLGVADAMWVRSSELCFGALCLRGEPVYAWDTAFSSLDSGLTEGFVGMGTLRRFLVTFDHAERVGLSFGGGACAGPSVALELDEHGIPHTAVSIDGTAPGSTPIDSGSTFTLLSGSTVARLDSYLGDESTPADLCTVDGCRTGVANIGHVHSYCVGGACETALEVKFPVFDAVGSSFLFRRKSSFDFQHSSLIFCE